MNLRQKIAQAVRFRFLRSFEFPKGNVTSCLLNLAERGFEPRHIFDVGANEGGWSRCARRVFPKCGITLIEPQVEMKKHLDEFCSRNEGCRWILAGAGDAIAVQATPPGPVAGLKLGQISGGENRRRT